MDFFGQLSKATSVGAGIQSWAVWRSTRQNIPPSPPPSLIFVFTKRKWKCSLLALRQHRPSPGLCYSLSVSPACDFTCRGTEDFYDIWYHVAIPLGQLTDLDPRITHSLFGNHAGPRTFFFSSCILSVITKGINYSARPGREGNNISKSLM